MVSLSPLLYLVFLATAPADIISGISHVCVQHLGSFELHSRVANPAQDGSKRPFMSHLTGQAECHNLTAMDHLIDGDGLVMELVANVNVIKLSVPVAFNSSSPMWVTYMCHGDSKVPKCELLKQWLPEASSPTSSNDTCALSLVDRVDCKVTDKTSCESQGCCWQSVKPNPTNAPFCFHKGSPGGGPTPPNKAQPFAPADCFVNTTSFSISELVLQENIVYGAAVNPYFTGGDKTEILKLDALFPPSRDQRKLRPAVVWMHGGSYLGGNKHDDKALRQAMASRGYVVISINYRMVSDGAIPAVWALLSIKPAVVAAEDARAAVRYLRKHANEWRLDPERIVVGGESAGAIASNLYGFGKSFTDGHSGNAGYDSSVNSVLSVSGSMRDLAFCATVGGPPKYQPLLCVISSPPGKDLTNDLSKGDIAVVDIHGTKDTTIPYMAGREMIDRAKAVGVQSLLQTIPGAGHVPMGQLLHAPYLLQWLHFVSGSLNLAQAECPPSSGPPSPPSPPSPKPPAPTPPGPTSCGFIGEAKDFLGSDVKQTTYDGHTDEEKDSSCCSACDAEAKCEYWVRATTSNVCWLKSGFKAFKARGDRRGNFKQGSCTFIGEVKDFIGHDVTQTTYKGNTEEDKDSSCCQQCKTEPKCDFWVRSTETNQCWLKAGFQEFKARNDRRGNFKNETTLLI